MNDIVTRRCLLWSVACGVGLVVCAPPPVLAQPNVTLEVVHQFGQSAGEGATPMAGVVVGPDGRLYGTTEYGGAFGEGTIFRFDTTAADPSARLKTLYDYANNANGRNPLGKLLLGADGNLYGTTSAGKSFGSAGDPPTYGALFRFTLNETFTAGTYTQLYGFTQDDLYDTFGAMPKSGLTQTADGSLFGAASKGVFRRSPGGVVSLIHSFVTETQDDLYAAATLIQGLDGRLYGTSRGTVGNGFIFVVDPLSSSGTVLHTFSGPPGGGPYGGLVQTADGTLFGTTTLSPSADGLVAGCGVIYKIQPSGTGYQEIHAFFSSAQDQGCSSYGGLIVGSDGKLYGTTARSVFRISSTGVYEQLYSFPNGYTSPPYPYGELVELGGKFYGTTSGPGSRGGEIFALTIVEATTLTTSAASGPLGGIVTLAASLSSGGVPIVGQTISFSLNGQFVGTAVTDSAGIASRPGTSLAGLSAGMYPTGVSATFAGTSKQSAASNSASLTVVGPVAPTMSLDRAALQLAATSSGVAFVTSTTSQTVRLRQTGAGAVTWTATSTKPWLTVSPTSGIGSATLSVGVRFAGGLAASQTGSIAFTLTGAGNVVGPITVTLTVNSTSAAANPPFGSFDTPAGDGTVLAGSVAVTGWTLDNIGVKRVELWRDLQPGETTPPFASTPSDPRNGKVFISNATFVDNARPDVEALYPNTPFAYRAGWGYLLLTWGLWNQGNGTYKLYAFAFDQEDNVATIGSKVIVVSNATAAKPFGSIDTPGIGADAGTFPNFGWGLTPKVNGIATCKIQPSGVQVSIDSGPLQPVAYGDARTDIAGAFPGFSNTAAAGGHFVVDWSTLTNGTHTIGWLITDDCNRTDGVGSRFFTVTNGTNLVASPAAGQSRLQAETPTAAVLAGNHMSLPESDAPITVAHGYGELPLVVDPALSGSRSIEVKPGERIEVRLPHGFDEAWQLGPSGEQRALPAGATWDADNGIFYWQPAAGFFGRYRFVFTDGQTRISVQIYVGVEGR